MKRRVGLILAVSLTATLLAVGLYFVFLRKSPSENNQNQTTDIDNTNSNSENMLVEDFETTPIDEILSSSATDDDKYTQLVSAALSKSHYGKIDEAIEYFKAIAELKDITQELKDDAEQNIYTLADQYNKTELKNEYALKLGDKLNQPAVQEDSDDSER